MDSVLDLVIRLVDGLIRLTRWPGARREARLEAERRVRLEVLMANRRLNLSERTESREIDRS